MVANLQRTQKLLDIIRSKFSASHVEERQKAKEKELPPSIRSTKTPSPESLDQYWRLLSEQCGLSENDKKILVDEVTATGLDQFEKNIENFIGTLKIPVGLIGPLRINGLYAQGDYYVPLATTEATLVASYARGAKLISAVGGCTSVLLNDGLPRAPVFEFRLFGQSSG